MFRAGIRFIINDGVSALKKRMCLENLQHLPPTAVAHGNTFGPQVFSQLCDQ
jgi:hypothetical protein